MARGSLTALRALGPDGSLYTANAADLGVVEMDPILKNQTPHTGKVLLLAHNVSVAPLYLTISSAVDSNGRTGDITEYSIGAGEYAVFGPFDLDGWAQTDMQIYCEPENFDMYLGVIDLSHS